MNEFDRMRRNAEINKRLYPPGTRIELFRMNDPYSPVEPMSTGTVVDVDDAGSLIMKWDNGRTLSVIPGEDLFRKITDEIITPQKLPLFESASAGSTCPNDTESSVDIDEPEPKSEANKKKTDQDEVGEDPGTSQNLTDERLDVVEVFGQTALFSNARILESQLPEGLYKYDLRQGGEMAFASMEKVVGVDHAGTLISSQPFDFSDDSCIPFDEDSSPNFLGYDMSLEEYMNASFEHSESQDTGGISM